MLISTRTDAKNGKWGSLEFPEHATPFEYFWRPVVYGRWTRCSRRRNAIGDPDHESVRFSSLPWLSEESLASPGTVTRERLKCRIYQSHKFCELARSQSDSSSSALVFRWGASFEGNLLGHPLLGPVGAPPNAHYYSETYSLTQQFSRWGFAALLYTFKSFFIWHVSPWILSNFDIKSRTILYAIVLLGGALSEMI